MPWQPLPRIAFAVATYPFAASHAADLPLEIGDELYIIEETSNGDWLRGYLVAPPSLLAGLTSVKGQTLEARVFSGIFPRSCVEIRELLGEADVSAANEDGHETADVRETRHNGSDPTESGAGQIEQHTSSRRATERHKTEENRTGSRGSKSVRNGDRNRLSALMQRDSSGPKPPAPVPMLKIGDETPTSVSEPLIDEIASCLREWHSTNLHELLLSRQYAKLDKVWQLICTLNSARQQFLHNVLTRREYKQLREKTVWDLVRVNKLCGGEVIVRDPAQRGRVLTGDDSVVELTTLQSTMSLLDEVPLPTAESTALHHLLVDVKGFAGASSESTTLLLYLASRSGGGPITQLSENYLVEIPAGGRMGHLTRNTLMRTLFVDLGPSDIGDAPPAADLFLVVKVHAAQPIVAAKPGSRAGSIKRDMGSHAMSKTKDPSQPPLTSGNKSMRRSLMWAGKSTRQAFSRGHSRLDPLDEHGEPKRPPTNPLESRDGQDYPPGTAGSKATLASVEGQYHGQGLMQGSNLTALRTVGVGVLSLNSIMHDGGDAERVVSIWSPTTKWSPDRSEDGKGHGSGSGMTDEWDPVLKDIMDAKTGQYEKSRRAERLQLHLRAFNHPDADVLIKATPTILSGICKTNKIGFAGAPTKPRSDIYITLDEAMLSRQTLLSRFGGSPASLPPSFHGSNLQVSLEVRKSTGERVENCIYASSNTDAVSTWQTAAAERGEPWRQTIRLLLPPQEVAGTHLALHVADIPNDPLAFAYMPLWDERAFIRDGPHALLLYRCDENTTTPLAAQTGSSGKQGGYLGAPWTLRGKSDQQADVTGPLAVLRIQTYLCSTRFSQDQVMLGLLQWRECPKEQVAELLKQMMFVAEIEVVKMLNDVLDSLFSILVEYQGKDEYEDLVFTALVRVLDIVHDRRFNLAPLVDQYAENRFNYPFATPCLVRSFTRLLSNPSEPDTARKLRATFKVVRHILKFITHARGQQKEKEAGIGISGTTPGFTRHIRAIFKALDAMMRSSAPVLVGSQTLAVQHFHTWLPELAGLLSTEEILHIAIDFVDSCANVKGKLILYKLVLIINYSRLDIFGHAEQRSALSANTIRWIAPHWGAPAETDLMEQWKDQVRLCCSILASQVDHLGPEIPDHMPKIIESYLAIQAGPRKQKKRLSLLFPTSYPFPSKPITAEGGVCFDEALMELSAVLSALSSSSTGMQLEVVDDDLGVMVENTLRVHMSILQGEAFPTTWLSVQIFHHKSTMRMLRYLAETILLDSFLPDPDQAESFNTELWKMFFVTLLQLVGSPSLALETFPEQKRRAVWKIAGDVREDGADLLRRTWEAIGWETSGDERQRYGLAKMGGYQVQYVPTLVGPIVELCLSVHEGLRRMAVEVLQTMMVSEWTLSEDLSVIQTEMIDCLDTYFKTKPLTESILQKLFVKELLDRFEPLARVPNEPMYAALRGLMATVNEFLDLLVAVHGGDGGVGEATNLIHRLRLMEFLRDMQKEEIFVRYVHQLATLQADARNHTEAGLALRLHADLYEWDLTRTVSATADPPFPSQSQFERKERIYFEMIKHFEDGEAWTSALDAYKELHVQYETNVFDFAKLARTERAMATIHETLARSDKLIPKYFKVVYKGLGFPTSLRDKQFIFQGSPAERTSAFIDRMQEQYPTAQILANDKIDDVEGQFLVISAISPHRNLNHAVFRRPRVPLAIRDYVLSSHPRLFSVTTRRSTSGPVAQHYAEKTVYTTNDPFPTILRRSEIVSVRHVRLSAKETALERIVRKTAEMTAVEKKLTEGEDQMAQLLVDAVRISVNPESENSVAIYRQLLPKTTPSPDVDVTGDEAQLDEQQDPQPFEVQLDEQETAIKTALVDHALMIKRCIATFSKINDRSNEALPVQDLEKYFKSTFAPEIATFSQPRPAMATSPAPSWPRSLPSTTFTPALPQDALPTSNSKPVNGNNAASITPGAAAAAAATAETAVVEEVSIVHPVKLHPGRGARLSFLSGRKKDAPEVPQQHMSPLPSSDGHHLPHNSTNGTNSHVDARDHEKDASHGRRSILLNTSNAAPSQPPHPPSEFKGDEPGWTAVPLPESISTTTGTNTGRASWDMGSRDNKVPLVTTQEQVAGGNKGTTVKKRFSMLKLGKKSSKASVLMGSLEEE